MKKRLLTIGVMILLVLLVNLVFVKTKEYKENESAECEGLLVIKCDYYISFSSNKEALELIEKHKSKLTPRGEEETEFYILLTKREATKLSEDPNVEHISKYKKIKASGLDSWKSE